MLLSNINIISFLKYFLYGILIFFLAFQGVFSNTAIAGIGINRLIEFMFFIFIIKDFLYDVNSNKVINITIKLLSVFALLLCVKIFVIFVLESNTDVSILKDFVRLVFIICPFYLVYYLLSKGIKIIELILIFNFPIMLIAFFQAGITPFTDIAWDIKWNIFGANSHGIEDTPWFRDRVTGIYSTSIPLAYAITTNIILASYLFIKTRHNIYILYFFFLGTISFFSLTRSVLLSWLIMLIYLGYKTFMIKGVMRKLVGIVMLSSLIFYGVSIYSKNSDTFDRVTNVKGGSAEGRVPLALTGIYTLVQHPFGVSEVDYELAKKEMYNIFHVENILIYDSHNGFLNIGFEYTSFGIIVLIFYFMILKRLMQNYFSKELQRFFIVAFFVYFANGIFHNNFIFIQNFSALTILSVFAYEYEIAMKRKEENEKS